MPLTRDVDFAFLGEESGHEIGQTIGQNTWKLLEI